MARREVLEVTCDRCGKTETQGKDDVTEALELEATFRGKKVSYEDLCARCRSAVDRYFGRIVKKEVTDVSKSPGVPQIEPKPKDEEQPKRRRFAIPGTR